VSIFHLRQGSLSCHRLRYRDLRGLEDGNFLSLGLFSLRSASLLLLSLPTVFLLRHIVILHERATAVANAPELRPLSICLVSHLGVLSDHDGLLLLIHIPDIDVRALEIAEFAVDGSRVTV
jgi:hypothetical protein